MSTLLFNDITVFVLSLLVGFEVITCPSDATHAADVWLERHPRRRRGRRDDPCRNCRHHAGVRARALRRASPQ
jgi:hypothetical protein